MSTPAQQHMKARAIAYYLPQFHPIPENDSWWGEGFTEWTNVRAARKLYAGHYQPRIPGDLGYYDLRSEETREAQADLAATHGIHGFCYWHYWFAGKQLLQRPFQEVLRSGRPRFPFCLGWANHEWTAAWVGRPYDVLVNMDYPGRADHEQHFRVVLDAFADDRYIRVDGKPLFLIFRPKGIPNARGFTDLWRELAHRAGLPGLFFVGILDPSIDPEPFGLDASVPPDIGHLLNLFPRQRTEALRRRFRLMLERNKWALPHQALAKVPRRAVPESLLGVHDRISRGSLMPLVGNYAEVVERVCAIRSSGFCRYPAVVPNWDNTPRRGRWGFVLEGSTPPIFARWVRHALNSIEHEPEEQRLLFIKSWNEWAEGNYLEPDTVFGNGYLEVLRRELRDEPRNVAPLAARS